MVCISHANAVAKEHDQYDSDAIYQEISISFFIAFGPRFVEVDANNEVFHARMDIADWQSDSSLLVCRVSQRIPFFGLAEFETWSGGELQFALNSERPAGVAQASAVLWSEAPMWKPQHGSKPIGEIALQSGAVPLLIERSTAAKMMAELYRGGTVRMKSDAWYTDEQPSTEIGLSPVSFRQAYRQFSACLGDLMPVAFDRLERSKIHFESDRYELEAPAIEWLNLLASFMSRSPEVERIYIDGHTDDTNTTTYNIELSRQRAEAVSAYLQQKGVAQDQIVVRYHGERFPIETNRSLSGKAANRRVTMRLEMSPEADLPS